MAPIGTDSRQRSALPLTVLISGAGSNLRAILAAIDGGTCDATVRAVVSDRASAQGLALATERGIPTAIVKLSDYPDRSAWDAALARTVSGFAPDLVVLAGFMKIVGEHMLAAFEGRILNVHPALLPAFPGSDGPAQAIAAGVRISGCTVHVVDGGVDTGPVVAQAAVRVLANDDAESLHARIQHAEHALFPAVIHGIARGSIKLGTRIIAADVPPGDERTVLLSPALGLPHDDKVP
jgi:phosphoribosylglycinamide formyltransferase 1